MIYGYARVSSKTQLKGNSVEEQRLLLEQNGCQEIIEEQYSGKTTDRPKFRALLERLAEGDTLVVCKLDRFARTVTEGIETVRELFRRKVKVHVLNVGLLEDTPMGNFFITTLLAVAELERCMILERTSAGKEIARTKPDYREGRPIKYSKEQIQLAMSLLDAGNSYSKVVSMTGISKASLVRYRRAFKNKG